MTRIGHRHDEHTPWKSGFGVVYDKSWMGIGKGPLMGLWPAKVEPVEITPLNGSPESPLARRHIDKGHPVTLFSGVVG
jgi:hypothetical protein